MCGRFTLFLSIAEITDEFEVYDVDWVQEPSYNIAPGQNIAGILKKDTNKSLTTLRWGLIPHWAKEENIGYRMINARAETLAQKPTFSRPLKTQRCIIPANGFYEWKQDIVRRSKTPFYINLRSGRPMGFAGLYDTWKSKEGKIITSCTIITTKPNDLLGQLHNRMPAILEPNSREVWLDKTIQEPGELMPLLKPYDASEMTVYEVSKIVNSTKFNGPDCIKPVKNIDHRENLKLF